MFQPRRFLCCACFIGMLVFPALVMAQPANDDCVDAEVIGNGTISVDTTGATTDGPSNCAGTFGSDIWYEYTATCDGDLTVSTCNMANYDSALAIYAGGTGVCTPGAGTQLGCNDDGAGCGLSSLLTVTVTSGDTYLIQVGGFNGAAGSASLSVTCAVPPPPATNDDCADAIAIGEGTFSFNTVGANTDLDQPCTTQDTNDIHYLYTPTCNGIANVNTCISPGPGTVDTALTVWGTDDCALAVAGNELACDDDGCGPGTPFSSEVDVIVTSGTTYLVTVSGWGGAGTVGSLGVTCIPLDPITNDDCVDAIEIFDGPNPFNNLGANTDGPSPCGTLAADVWFTYTATCDGNITVSTCNDAIFDTAIAIYPGGSPCPPLLGSELVCNDVGPGCALGTSEATVALLTGETILIQVGGTGGAEGGGIVNVTCTPAPPPPVNDLCMDAIPIFDGVTDFDTTSSLTDLDFPCTGQEFGDIHYVYTATCTGILNVNTCDSTGVPPGSTVDTALVVWDTNDCIEAVPGNELGCDDDSCGPGTGFSSDVSGFVTSGVEYLVSVSGWGGAPAIGSLTITCTPLPPITNNACADAIPVLSGDTAFHTFGSTTDGPAPCGALANDVWFLWTADCDGNIEASTCNQADFDTVIAVYPVSAGCPPPLGSEIGCNDDSVGCVGLTSLLSAPVTNGEQYLIQVAGFGGAQGFGTLSVNCVIPPPPPANDDCADAEILPAAPAIVIGQAVTATDDAATPCGLNDATPDVHYIYQAPADELLTADTCLSVDPAVDTIVTIWATTADCPGIQAGTAPFLACGDDGCGPGPGFASEATAAVSAGNDYIVTVAGWAGVGYEFSLQIQAGAAVLPEPCDPATGTSFTDSLSQSVQPFNSVSCNAGGTTADNGYFRDFDLAANGVTDSIDVVAIEIGIEVSTPGFGFNTQPVNVNLYADTDSDPAPVASLTPLGGEGFFIPNYDGPGLQCFLLTTPITVPSGTSHLAVEIDIPDAFAMGTGHSFFIGSNNLGEESPTYLRSAACAFPEPTPVAALGFPNMHLVMNVYFGGPVGPSFIRADADGNAIFNGLVDALFILAFQFQGGPAPVCMEAADADGNAIFNGLVDALFVLAHQFQGGAPPPAPYPACGQDPDPGTSLGCAPNACP